MIDILQALPWPVQVLFAVVFAVTVVGAGIILFVWLELEADEYWKKLK